MRDYTRQLAKYLVNLRYEDIPPEVLERAKLLIMHVCGVTIAGNGTTMGRHAVELAQEQMGSGADMATILGVGTKVSAMGAAFANGTMADVLDWEDCSWTGHPSAGAIPAAMAVAESKRACGKDLLTAIVGGYDVYQRIGMAVQPDGPLPKGDGWGLTSWQIFAAAMPAAKLWGFDEYHMDQAIGMAATLTPVAITVTHNTRSDAYHYHHGFVARDGIASCYAVEKGFATLTGALENCTGYVKAVNGSPIFDYWYTKDLGEKYLIMETLFKHWPANMWIQVPLDQLDSLVKTHGFGKDDIASMTVLPNIKGRMTFHPEGFESLVDAQFSIPYCLAMYFYEEASAHWADEKYLKDKELLEFASRITSYGEDCNVLFPVFQAGDFIEYTLEVNLKDGRKLKDVRKFSKGHPRNPFTFEEETELFRLATKPYLSEAKQNRAIELFRTLETLDDISELVDCLRSDTGIL